MHLYHVKIRGRSLGPYTLDRIRQMVRLGEVGRTHEVSTDGLAWAPSTSFPEIFERGTLATQAATTHAALAPVATAPGAVVPVAAAPASAGAPARSAPATPPAGEACWYRARQGVADGPMPRSRLYALIQTGEVTGTTFVYKDGMSDWMPACDVQELAAAFRARAAIALDRNAQP